MNERTNFPPLCVREGLGGPSVRSCDSLKLLLELCEVLRLLAVLVSAVERFEGVIQSISALFALLLFEESEKVSKQMKNAPLALYRASI